MKLETLMNITWLVQSLEADLDERGGEALGDLAMELRFAWQDAERIEEEGGTPFEIEEVYNRMVSLVRLDAVEIRSSGIEFTVPDIVGCILHGQDEASMDDLANAQRPTGPTASGMSQ